MKEEGVRVKELQLPDLHAANLFLQTFLMLQVGGGRGIGQEGGVLRFRVL
jgi:hypothetical protein